MTSVFISYRRSDSIGHTGWLGSILMSEFGRDRIFMDIDSIDPGVDFRERIESAVGSCDVLLAVIGKEWVESRLPSGQRRLDSSTDLVRAEVRAALKRGIRVIPVLIQGAAMPTLEELPPDISDLAWRNAMSIRDEHFAADAALLVQAIRRAVGGQGGQVSGPSEAAGYRSDRGVDALQRRTSSYASGERAVRLESSSAATSDLTLPDWRHLPTAEKLRLRRQLAAPTSLTRAVQRGDQDALILVQGVDNIAEQAYDLFAGKILDLRRDWQRCRIIERNNWNPEIAETNKKKPLYGVTPEFVRWTEPVVIDDTSLYAHFYTDFRYRDRQLIISRAYIHITALSAETGFKNEYKMMEGYSFWNESRIEMERVARWELLFQQDVLSRILFEYPDEWEGKVVDPSVLDFIDMIVPARGRKWGEYDRTEVDFSFAADMELALERKKQPWSAGSPEQHKFKILSMAYDVERHLFRQNQGFPRKWVDSGSVATVDPYLEAARALVASACRFV